MSYNDVSPQQNNVVSAHLFMLNIKMMVKNCGEINRI